jgi:bifunctional UDP-N-acetylglucosamine pyrophosphorylase/glucosamine-1-phosphate N-acetyltransferase
MNPPSPDPAASTVSTQTGRTTAVVLAAGLGTRMKSSTAKVLHPLCGRPMLAYVLDAWAEIAAKGDATPRPIVV